MPLSLLQVFESVGMLHFWPVELPEMAGNERSDSAQLLPIKKEVFAKVFYKYQTPGSSAGYWGKRKNLVRFCLIESR